ncbi:MAG: glycosyltransferase family 39 protein [Myxococcota bacterium]|nr:glycosyltransferase family 39 protein [Myxococcota bacterium]
MARLALPGEQEVRGGGAALGWILVLSTLLKLALLVPAHQTYPVGDARDYLRGAHQLRDGHYVSIRPPLWPATLRVAIALAETTGGAEAVTPVSETLPGQRRPPRAPLSDLDWARLLQVGMSGVTVWLVFLLGRALFDRRAGLVAAGLFAFDPGFVGYTHLLWGETLLALLNVGWALLLLRGVREGRAGLLCGAGALLGLAALTRQLMMNFALLAAAWIFLLRPRREALRLAAVFGLFAVLAVLPWTIRNAAFHGRFLPIAPTGGWALLHGVTYDVEGEMERAGILDGLHRPEPIAPIETERLARERAFEIIRADPGGYLVRTVSVNLPDLWRLGSRLLEYARYGTGEGPRRQHGYGAVPGWLGLLLVVAVCGLYLLGMTSGLLGMAVAPRWRETLLFGALLAQACGLHAIVGANLRHRLYVMPFVLLYAGFALSRRPAEWRALLTRGRVAVAGALLGAFLLALAAADHREVREQWLHFRLLARTSG